MAAIYLGILTVTLLFGIFWWWGLIRVLIKAKGKFERPRQIVGLYLLIVTLSGGIITLIASDWLMTTICIIFPPVMFILAQYVVFEYALWVFLFTYAFISVGFLIVLGYHFIHSDKVVSVLSVVLLVIAPITAQNFDINAQIRGGYEQIGGECLSYRSFLHSMSQGQYLSLKSNIVGNFHAVAWVDEKIFVWSYKGGAFVNISPSSWKSFAPDNQCREF